MTCKRILFTDSTTRTTIVSHNLLLNEYSQSIPDDLLCPRKSPFYGLPVSFTILTETSNKSGQSLIEHSYRADSDLSPAGWEYAARLKEFVLERRAKALKERGLDPKDRKLVVGPSIIASNRGTHILRPLEPIIKLIVILRFGPPLVVVRTTRLGLSFHQRVPFPLAYRQALLARRPPFRARLPLSWEHSIHHIKQLLPRTCPHLPPYNP